MLHAIGGTMSSEFFEKRTEPSEVKATIVQKYFDAWSKIILPTAKKFYGGKIAYVDLYAGPGRYQDGAASTPLLVLQKAIENPEVAQALVALLNDQDKNNTATLADEISRLPGVDTLAHQPVVLQDEVGDDADRLFARAKQMPRFTFLDPFGYKGMSQQLVNRVICDWDVTVSFSLTTIGSMLAFPILGHLDF